MKLITPILDLADMSVSADFWQTSMNEHEQWERLRLECKAKEDARKAET